MASANCLLTLRSAASASAATPVPRASISASVSYTHLVLPIAHDIRFTLTKPQVKGLEMTPLGQLYLETAWLEQ